MHESLPVLALVRKLGHLVLSYHLPLLLLSSDLAVKIRGSCQAPKPPFPNRAGLDFYMLFFLLELTPSAFCDEQQGAFRLLPLT